MSVGVEDDCVFVVDGNHGVPKRDVPVFASSSHHSTPASGLGEVDVP